MLQVEKGGEYTAARFRTGDSETGKWEIIAVKEVGGAHREVSIFAANVPCGVKEHSRFRVDEITKIRFRRKKDANGKWTLEDKPIVEAVMSPIEEVGLDSDISGDLGFDDFYGSL